MNEHCPRVANSEKGDDKKMNEVNRAVWCTNQQVIDRALASATKPDYIIIMEDDLMIEKPFWVELQKFLNGCQEDSWDLTAVDTFWRKEVKPELSGKQVCKYMDGEYALY